MNKIIWIILAFLSGTFLPVQAGLNTRLGKAAQSPVHAALLSFIIGTVAIITYIIITKQTFSWTGLKTAPAYAWAGGLLGAFYVTVIILAFPQLGPGLTFGLIVAGQMILSLFLEHFNLLVSEPHPINLPRVLGVLLIVAGVIVIRKF
ncbi:MAG: DMT family transporter [Bacteroidota bacterium]